MKKNLFIASVLLSIGLITAPAFFHASAAPSISVTTLASTSSPSLVTLNGNLDSVGTASSVSLFFEYGTTTSYGSLASGGVRTSPGAFTNSLSTAGLLCSTTYQYRTAAGTAGSDITTGAGIVYGTNMSFTTTAATPCLSSTVVTNPATAVTATTATLNGNLTAIAGATTLSFEYGTTIAYGLATTSTTALSTGAYSMPVSALLCATTYHYRAKAVGVTTVYGTDMTFTTGPCVPATPCAAPVAGAAAVLHGYAWSSTIGWVSLNCAESPGSSNYKVSVNNSTGVFSGYAWSSNVGWIGFNSADVASCGAQAVLSTTTNLVTGWARVLSGTVASGADGCINLGTTGNGDGLAFSPGVSVTMGTTTLPGSRLAGFTWGSTNVGWLNFSNVSVDASAGAVDLKASATGIPAADAITMPTSAGGSANLIWTSSGVTSCSADTAYLTGAGWTGAKTPTAGGTSTVAIPANTTLSTTSYTFGIKCTGSLGGVYADTVTISVPPTASVTVTVTPAPTCAAYIGTPGTTSYTVTPTSLSVDGMTVPNIGVTWSDGTFRPMTVSMYGDLPLSQLKNDTTGDTGTSVRLTAPSMLTALLGGTVSTVSPIDLTIEGSPDAGTGYCAHAIIHINPAPAFGCKITPGSSAIAFSPTSTENAITFRVTKPDGTPLENPVRASLDPGTTGFTYDPFSGMADRTMTVVLTDRSPINYPGVMGFIYPSVAASPGAVVDLVGTPPAAGTRFTLHASVDGETPVECSAVYTASSGSANHRPPWKEF